MFEIGTTKHWWDMAKKYPSLSKHEYTLKPLGYAEAIRLIEENNFQKILEVGHGAGSFAFNILRDKLEFWGLDDVVKDSAVPESDLLKFRNWYPNVKFVSGLLGNTSEELPPGYFDMVFSVSVIEHIPHDQLLSAFQDAFRLLRQGGMMFHSYDVYYGQNVKAVFDTYEKTGFKWLKPRDTMNVFWEDWLCQPDAAQIKEVITLMMTENPMFVAEVYMWQTARENRPAPQNWLTILTCGVK